MARKSKIIFIFLGATVVLSVVVAIVASPPGKTGEQEKMAPRTTREAPDASPSDGCIDPEAEILRQLQQRGANTWSEQEKLKGLPVLEEGEARCRAQRNLSPEQKAKITEEEKQLRYEQHLRELEDREKMAPPAPPPELGILPYPIDAKLLGDGFSPPTSSWRGQINGELITVAGSALSSDPMQGMVFVMKDSSVATSKTYPTPTATGPVKIVSESNGVLTLKSIASTYEVYHEDTDTRESVKTPGGATYYFDVKTRVFQ